MNVRVCVPLSRVFTSRSSAASSPPSLHLLHFSFASFKNFARGLPRRFPDDGYLARDRAEIAGRLDSVRASVAQRLEYTYI